MTEAGTIIQSGTTAMRLTACGVTDVGRRRSHNEDRYLVDEAAGLFVVADGVGGYAAGEVAAEMACSTIAAVVHAAGGPPEATLRAAIAEASNAIYHAAQADPAHAGMACVLTAVLVRGGTVTVGHVGDTRLYEVHPDSICKVTRDHSIVGMFEDDGLLDELQAMRHPRRNEILRDVGSALHGPDDDGFVETCSFEARPRATLVLCSDGLTDMVPQDAVHQTVLAYQGQPRRAAAALVSMANDAGGHDNVTVVVIEGAALEKKAYVWTPIVGY